MFVFSADDQIEPRVQYIVKLLTLEKSFYQSIFRRIKDWDKNEKNNYKFYLRTKLLIDLPVIAMDTCLKSVQICGYWWNASWNIEGIDNKYN